MTKCDVRPRNRNLRSLVSGVLTHVGALALIGAAFCYYAGYTYLNHLYREFGLIYGATSPTTAEVIGWGYLVTLYSVLQAIESYLPIWMWEILILSALLGLACLIAAKHREFGEWAIAKVEKSDPAIQAVSSVTAFAAICFLTLFASGPWGAAAAKVEITAVKRSVSAGCCFNYSDGETRALGKALAMDKDHLFLVTRKGLVTLNTSRLKITRTVRRTHGRSSPATPR